MPSGGSAGASAALAVGGATAPPSSTCSGPEPLYSSVPGPQATAASRPNDATAPIRLFIHFSILRARDHAHVRRGHAPPTQRGPPDGTHCATALYSRSTLYAGNVIQFARSSRRRDTPCLEGFDRTRNPIGAQAMGTSSLVARQVANFRARSFDAQFFMPGDDLRRGNAGAMPRRASLCHFPDTADDDSPLTFSTRSSAPFAARSRDRLLWAWAPIRNRETAKPPERTCRVCSAASSLGTGVGEWVRACRRLAEHTRSNVVPRRSRP